MCCSRLRPACSGVARLGGELLCTERTSGRQQQAADAAQGAQQPGLQQESGEDVPASGAERAQQADLAGAAQAEGPGLGKPLSAADLAPWDISIMPDGTGLPPGSVADTLMVGNST